MKSVELKKLYAEIGQSIHSMNTIAVSLSIMPDENVKVPDTLQISWSPRNISFSKRVSRSYAERSAVVYATESFFEYLDNISKNNFWKHDKITFQGNEKKADKVFIFLKQIPELQEYEIILAELLCHWRNKIVHLKASPTLIKKKIRTLRDNKDHIYQHIHHFDVDLALEHFDQNTITLKDASTLITIALKCAESIDNFFISEMAAIGSSELLQKFLIDMNFKRIYNQPNVERRQTQLKLWISTNYPYFTDRRLDTIVKEL